MGRLESTVFEHINSKKMIYWYRYIGDVIACFAGINRQLDSLFDYINNIYPNITITAELEQTVTILFLV